MLQIHSAVMLSRVDDEIVLLDGRTGKYYGLNPVGSRLVELLLESPNFESAAQRAVSEFEAPEQQIRTDFQRMFADLRARGLIDEESV